MIDVVVVAVLALVILYFGAREIRTRIFMARHRREVARKLKE